jgi:hypothetical protein
MVMQKRVKRLGVLCTALALLCGGSAFAYYHNTAPVGPAGHQTVYDCNGPVTYYQGRRVMSDGHMEPVIQHRGYVVNQNGEVEMTGPCYTDGQGYGHHGNGGYYGGCHR